MPKEEKREWNPPQEREIRGLPRETPRPEPPDRPAPPQEKTAPDKDSANKENK